MDANQKRQFALSFTGLRRATGIDAVEEQQKTIEALVNRLMPHEEQEALEGPLREFLQGLKELAAKAKENPEAHQEMTELQDRLDALVALRLVRDVLARQGRFIDNIYELVDEMKRLTQDRAALKELREFCGLALELLGDNMLISTGSDQQVAGWIFQTD